jgi:peptidoglycan/LPS O-acetylase OafA/YrhL
VLFRHLGDLPALPRKLAARLAPLTFGVYFVHVLVLNTITDFIGGLRFIIGFPAAFLGTAAVSYLAAFVFSKLPVLKKLLL